MPSDRLLRFLPISNWIRSYNRNHLKGDLNAGFTVAIMLIPQAMAYSVLAGLPPVYGLYSSIIPLIIYAVLGTSRHLAVGPAAVISILILSGISQFEEAGTEHFIQLAILTSLMAGVIQILMGFFRMGFLVNFLSRPVLSGFVSGAAVIIVLGQLGNLLGMDTERSDTIQQIILSLTSNIHNLEPAAAIMGFLAIVVIYILYKWKPAFPAAFLVIVVTTLATALFHLNQYGVSVVGSVPSGLPSFVLPELSAADLRLLMPVALIIALISYIESFAIGSVFAKKHGYSLDANQELIALGFSKTGGSFFQAFPVTGGFSRSAVNDQSGSRTPMSSILTAVIIAFTLLFLTPLLYYLPGAILAAIIIASVARLFEMQEMINLWKTDRTDLLMMMTTLLVTITVGIEVGIGLGVTLSLIMVLYSSSTPHSAELGRLGDSRNFRNIKRYPDATVEEDVLIYRFDGPLYFASVGSFQNHLETLVQEKGSTLELVILDASTTNHIDSTGLQVLEEVVKDLQQRRIQLSIAGAIGPVRDKLKLAGIVDSIGPESFFFDIDQALTTYRKQDPPESGYSPLQNIPRDS